MNGRCFMGGEPPRGVTPSRVEKGTRYFATLGLETGVDVSLFTTFEYQAEDSPFSFFCGAYKLHKQSNAVVQFVVHGQTWHRETASALANDLPVLGFAFGTPGTDPDCPALEDLGKPAIYSHHKVGGQPYFGQLEGEAGLTLDLLRNDYVHLLQVAFPSINDTLVDVDWPFGESVFHVFARKTSSAFDFRYIWG